MKKTLICSIFSALVSTLFAQVSLQVCESDGTTPFDDRNIAVGTKLILVVASDSNDSWLGGLFLTNPYRESGQLSGSGYDPYTRDWTGCHTTSAGDYATAQYWEDSLLEGFELYSSEDCVPGNWFILDYTALAPGESRVGFYDYDISWDEPNSYAVIRQVPAADFNLDGAVNLADFSRLSFYWQSPQDPCSIGRQAVDLYRDGAIDINDLMEFSDYWMWSYPEPNQGDPNQGDPNQGDPNVIEPTPDPNMIYSIVDANGVSEITIAPGQSITLYIDMTNINDSNLWAFNVEADISDPNLGSIDNRAYDSNNPPGPGTARILAGPNRWDVFDGWGPGYQQQEGISLSGVSSSGAFADGHLASFVFTCQGPGDVLLNLINWDSTSTVGGTLYPTLEGILIHQVEPNEPMMMMSGPTGEGMLFAPEPAASFTTETTTAEQPVQIVSQEEMIEFLETLYAEDESIRQTISEEDWNAFITSVEESY